MPLRVRFFQVRKGDSILIEKNGRYVIVDCDLIDSRDGLRNPLVEYLKSHSIKEIQSVFITHFDKDHFTGIESVLNDYNVKKLYIPPIFGDQGKVRDKFIKDGRRRVDNIVHSTIDNSEYRPAWSLAYILQFMGKNADRVQEIRGYNTCISPFLDGADDCYVHLPNKKMVGTIRDLILQGKDKFDSFPAMNDISLAISLVYKEKRILLTGDSTLDQWLYHQKIRAREASFCISSDVIKSPHHGSKENNSDDLYKYLFRDTSDSFVVISANGSSHPHREVLTMISSVGAKPLCTNLSRHCVVGGDDREKVDNRLPAPAKMFVLNYPSYHDKKLVPCQGDITIEIDDNGGIGYSSTGMMSCIY